MHCYRCERVEIQRSGYVKGKQRYYCKACNYHFTERVPVSEDPVKIAVVKLYCSGVSFRQTGRLQGVSHTTARRWVKQYADQLPAVPFRETSVIVD